MGFICIICRQLLKASPGEEDGDHLVATICGHLFHRKCLSSTIGTEMLNRTRGREKAQCPSCSRYLVSEQASFKLHPVEADIIESESEESTITMSNAINDIMLLLHEENQKLKNQLKNLISIAENLNVQLKCKRQSQDSLLGSLECLDIPVNQCHFTTSLEKQNSYSDVLYKRRQSLPLSICSSKSDCDSLIRSPDSNYLSDYYTNLIKTTERTDRRGAILSLRPENVELSMLRHTREDKRKNYKSIRRAFLTTRNKTSSWLTKMTSKATKLISEPILSDTKSITQQIAEIQFFMNKIETHGVIIERFKQAARTLISHEGVAPMEQNLTESCSKELERDFCDMHLRTSDRMVTLEIALIRCGEMEDFIEESHCLIEDVERKLKVLQGYDRDQQLTKNEKAKLFELSGIFRLTDAHKANIDAVKLSENDFRSCDYSQILPETESKLREIDRRYNLMVKRLKGMLEAIIESNSSYIQTNKHIRTPVFV